MLPMSLLCTACKKSLIHAQLSTLAWAACGITGTFYAAIVSEYKRRGGRGSGAYFGTLGPGYLFTGDMDRAKSGEGGGIISGRAYNRQFVVFFFTPSCHF